MSTTMVRLCALEELTDGGVRSFEVGDRLVAVVRDERAGGQPGEGAGDAAEKGAVDRMHRL